MLNVPAVEAVTGKRVIGWWARPAGDVERIVFTDGTTEECGLGSELAQRVSAFLVVEDGQCGATMRNGLPCRVIGRHSDGLCSRHTSDPEIVARWSAANAKKSATCARSREWRERRDYTDVTPLVDELPNWTFRRIIALRHLADALTALDPCSPVRVP